MKTKNTLVGILAAVLVVALWWTMLLKPTRAKAEKVRADTAIEQSRLEPLVAQLAKAQRDAVHAATFKTELESLQSAMPDSPALAAFIRDANSISQASGVAWQSVTHGPPTLGTDGVNSITLGIQVKGTYAQVIDYLGRLAALQRLVVVDGVQLSTSASTGATTAGATGGESTGPFSGASQLSAAVTARMFESPGASSSAGTGVAAAPSASATPSATAGNTAGLNNS